MTTGAETGAETVILVPNDITRYSLEYDYWHKNWAALALIETPSQTKAWYRGTGNTIELANADLHGHIAEGEHLGIVEYNRLLTTKKGKGYRVLEDKKQEQQKNAPPLEELF